MPSVTIQSPAKLNLVLDVLGRRPDGFHELRTIFERIDLADSIRITQRRDNLIKVECDHPQVPKGPGNLVVRIARHLMTDFQITQGVTIRITKRIPVAAGLAGGSSNGAAVLLGLNRLWRLNLTQAQMMSYATALGSDVAFFIAQTPYALGEGRGEQLTPLKGMPKLWHVLVTPKVKMLTKDVFKALAEQRLVGKLKLTKKTDNVNILLPFLRQGKLAQLGSAFSNDLEPAILKLRPDFCLLKRKLSDAGAIGVCFSGSGPSVFALAESKAHAKAIVQKFDKRFAQVFVVSTF